MLASLAYLITNLTRNLAQTVSCCFSRNNMTLLDAHSYSQINLKQTSTTIPWCLPGMHLLLTLKANLLEICSFLQFLFNLDFSSNLSSWWYIFLLAKKDKENWGFKIFISLESTHKIIKTGRFRILSGPFTRKKWHEKDFVWD